MSDYQFIQPHHVTEDFLRRVSAEIVIDPALWTASQDPDLDAEAGTRIMIVAAFRALRRQSDYDHRFARDLQELMEQAEAEWRQGE